MAGGCQKHWQRGGDGVIWHAGDGDKTLRFDTIPVGKLEEGFKEHS